MAPLLKYAIFGLAAVVTTGGVAVSLAHARWQAATDRVRSRLASANPDDAAPFSAADLAGLPQPVARYFASAIRSGQPLLSRVTVDWTGQFNMGNPTADRWVPFEAQQDFFPAAPGMVWDARMRMAPGFPVYVRDAFVEGSGSMKGAVLGLFPVIDVSGTDEIAVASLQRYLGEAVWFPTALLPRQGVVWTAVDDTRAVATLRAGGVTASVEFRFGPDGLVTSSFVPDRLFDDGKGLPRPTAWQGRLFDYRWEGGLLVPGRAVAEWLLPSGPYAYWRGAPRRITYAMRPPAAGDSYGP